MVSTMEAVWCATRVSFVRQLPFRSMGWEIKPGDTSQDG
jgi:hypothetical protein